MEIVRKTARDGHTTIVVSLHEPTSPLDGHRLVVTHGGRELPVLGKRPRRMHEPIGELTHGLVVGVDSRSVGLTTEEARQIDAAVDTWEAEHLGVRPTDAEVRAAVAAMDCGTCGRKMSQLDMQITSVEGHHPDCV